MFAAPSIATVKVQTPRSSSATPVILEVPDHQLSIEGEETSFTEKTNAGTFQVE